MKRTKILSLIIAGVLTVAVVGGTLAYFISKDSVTNSFTTAKTGVKVEEKFDKDAGASVKPGDEVNKDVSVRNKANYAQFIRVKLTPKFTGTDTQGLDVNKIKLNIVEGAIESTPTEGKWFKDGDYYYYVGKVAPEVLTAQLLDSVTLDASATEDKYQGQGYDVVVEAEGIQADHDAYTDWGVSKDSDLGKKLSSLQ